jgi:hypothetical protein
MVMQVRNIPKHYIRSIDSLTGDMLMESIISG